MLRWCQKYILTDNQIKNAFKFAWDVSLSTKSRSFQYKIATHTLPTAEYLWNYQVRDNYLCGHCISDTAPVAASQ